MTHEQLMEAELGRHERVRVMEARRGLVSLAHVAAIFTLWGVGLYAWSGRPIAVAGLLALSGFACEMAATARIERLRGATEDE